MCSPKSFFVQSYFYKLVLFLLLITLFSFLGKNFIGAAYADKVNLIVPLTNLQADLKLAKNKKQPILLFFSAVWCDYCDILEEGALGPMANNADYSDSVIIRKVSIDKEELFINANGEKTLNLDKFAKKYDVFVTPTTIFIDYKGKEIAPRILGTSLLDLYPSLVSKSVTSAYEKLGNNATISW